MERFETAMRRIESELKVLKEIEQPLIEENESLKAQLKELKKINKLLVSENKSLKRKLKDEGILGEETSVEKPAQEEKNYEGKDNLLLEDLSESYLFKQAVRRLNRQGYTKLGDLAGMSFVELLNIPGISGWGWSNVLPIMIRSGFQIEIPALESLKNERRYKDMKVYFERTKK